MEGVSFSDNARNIVVRCDCGTEFEPVPRGSGTVNTVGGRLTWNGAAVTAARALVASTAEELEALQKALRSASAPDADLTVIAAQLEQLNAGFADFAELMRNTSGNSRSVLIATWLGALASVIAVIMVLRGGPKPATADDIERLLRQEVATAQQAQSPQPTPAAAPQSTRPPPRTEPARVERPSGLSRNAPCHCGSGRKFKRCHGSPPAAGTHP
jgi:hypothetical protein